MSRILRRPMFRGGSPNNGGIMSYAQPRKGYADPGPGGVQGFDLSNYPYNQDNQDDNNETIAMGGNNESLSINPQILQTLSNNIQKQKSVPAQTGEKKSYSDILMEEYLGNRSDPMGKFLINFGLNYMSARPRGGKFGAFATAADAAKKPTEQLYADQDTDRLLKLKLMGALSKSENKGAFDKKIDSIWKSEQEKPEEKRRFNSRQEVVDTVTDFERYTKEQSPAEKIEKRTNEILKEPGGAPTRDFAKNKAEFELYSINKLPKEEKEKINLREQIFIESGNIIKKPNSTEDFMLDVGTEGKLKQFKTNRNYVDPSTRSVYTYLGTNTFRFVQKY